MKTLNPLDATWLFVDSARTPMHVANLSIYSMPEDAPDTWFNDIVSNLRQTRHFAAPFNLRLTSPRLKSVFPTWSETADIDIDYHFRHSALPRPGGERELGVLISRLHSHPMDFTRPLWECHLIEGLENNRFALYVKMHHSLVDGVGGMRMLTKMLSFDPAARDLPPPWSVGTGRDGPRPPRPGAGRTPWEKLRAGLQRQGESMPELSRAFADLTRQAAKHETADWVLPFEGPKSILNGKVSAQRRFATQHYSLDRVKKVAKAAGVTVNDVFLGLSAAALRRYLGELDQLPSKSLTAGLPVSVRPADDEHSGNAISFIISSLHTEIADPVERLKAIHASTQVAKEHLQSLPKAGINNYTMLYMSPYVLQLLTGLGGVTRPMFNLTISNVPGPDRPLYFNGARLEQMYPVSLLSDGQALNITSVSYAGQFNIGFTGCRDILPSMQHLAVYTGEALEELEAETKAKRVA
ncbi:wax ester/triacylglycerol synthase family O-acyltransferase [Solimonas fluminis]|uniref:diacylglycerol O-acyltransferase n=1 Tax=Solimonas fluminis TaxID=2086571 RepID=A0A2S5TIL2_9GAMM|nr:wax ester/triacylglycerol synthase family O-acyltransferase [Solimonas fluminis]PPE74824.1 wax ester/triacylglycerol synthase family O-acyltransferase [Solimonas fluminis]